MTRSTRANCFNSIPTEMQLSNREDPPRQTLTMTSLLKRCITPKKNSLPSSSFVRMTALCLLILNTEAAQDFKERINQINIYGYPYLMPGKSYASDGSELDQWKRKIGIAFRRLNEQNQIGTTGLNFEEDGTCKMWHGPSDYVVESFKPNPHIKTHLRVRCKEILKDSNNVETGEFGNIETINLRIPQLGTNGMARLIAYNRHYDFGKDKALVLLKYFYYNQKEIKDIWDHKDNQKYNLASLTDSKERAAFVKIQKQNQNLAYSDVYVQMRSEDVEGEAHRRASRRSRRRSPRSRSSSPFSVDHKAGSINKGYTPTTEPGVGLAWDENYVAEKLAAFEEQSQAAGRRDRSPSPVTVDRKAGRMNGHYNPRPKSQ